MKKSISLKQLLSLITSSMLFTFLIIVFTSCGGDDDELNSEEKIKLEREAELSTLKKIIIGSWGQATYYNNTFGKYYSLGKKSNNRVFYTFNSDGTYIYNGSELPTMGNPSNWKYEISDEGTFFQLTLKTDFEPWDRHPHVTIYGSNNDTLRLGNAEYIRVKPEDLTSFYKEKFVGTWDYIGDKKKGETAYTPINPRNIWVTDFTFNDDGTFVQRIDDSSLFSHYITKYSGDFSIYRDLDETYFITISWHKSGTHIINKVFNDFEFSDNYNTLFIYNEDKSTKFAKKNN